jgi:hypothetical protein
MRPSNKSRSRNKNNNNNRPRNIGNIVNRVFDSAGPDGKVRGTPQQVIDKYLLLARDAQLAGDRVAAENFQQHAEHYCRMLNEALRESAELRQGDGQGGYASQNGYNGGMNGNGHPGDDGRDYQPYRQDSQPPRGDYPAEYAADGQRNDGQRNDGQRSDSQRNDGQRSDSQRSDGRDARNEGRSDNRSETRDPRRGDDRRDGRRDSPRRDDRNGEPADDSGAVLAGLPAFAPLETAAAPRPVPEAMETVELNADAEHELGPVEIVPEAAEPAAPRAPRRPRPRRASAAPQDAPPEPATED